MEMKRNHNWRPRRSIILLIFGCEEYALTGSIEWVEEYKKKLLANSVTYINMDSILMGNYSFGVKTSPLLFDFIHDVAKTIPYNSMETVFDRWLKNEPNKDQTAPM